MYIRLLFRAGIYSFCWKVENFVIQYRVRVYFSVFFPSLEMFQSSKTVYFLRLFVFSFFRHVWIRSTVILCVAALVVFS